MMQTIATPEWIPSLEEAMKFISEQGFVPCTKEELDEVIATQPEILRGRWTHALGTPEDKGGSEPFFPNVNNWGRNCGKPMKVEWLPCGQNYLGGTCFLVKKA
jgi:hypothetical protein